MSEDNIRIEDQKWSAVLELQVVTYGYCLENVVHLKIIVLRLLKYHWLM